VESVAEGCVKVRILQTSACAACKVASHCNASDKKEKIVEVFCDDAASYQKGQEVRVTASKQVAANALLLGFGLPFLLLMLILIVTLKLSGNEGVAAIAALASLAPYYLVLWLFKDRIRQRLAFALERN
jgi:sigma-E factor negative regulatory protein RseC